MPRKILLIRFSSIGDVVLTTPVIRGLRICFPEAEIHFLTKVAYAPLLERHPEINKLHLFREDLNETLRALRSEKFDLVLDLHSSIRSRWLRFRLGVKGFRYRKGSLRTRLYTRFRIGSPEPIHVVERYEEVLKKAGCTSTGHPLEMHLDKEAVQAAAEKIQAHFGQENPIAVNLGGKFATKKWLPERYAEVLNQLGRPVMLLGGETEKKEATLIEERAEVPVLNAVASAGLAESMALLSLCSLVITHDSGLMHVAAAFGKPIVSIWGHSLPAFGFAPWKTESVIVETHGLRCRPCSKLGYDSCPKGHFKCMRDITVEQVLTSIHSTGK